METGKMLIGGEWVEALAGGRFEVRNPANGDIIALAADGGAEEARMAVQSARDAFGPWAARPAHERSAVLYAWHRLILEHRERLARQLTLEQGKPLAEAEDEIDYAASFVLWYAEEARRVHGMTVPASAAEKRLLVIRQPVGVVGAITPWNWPAAMVTRKVAPALAAGCTVVLKPASRTPLTAIALFRLLEKAGCPPGVVNLVTGDASSIAREFMENENVRKVTFTGSTEVGKLLMRQASRHLTKLSLELGGHAAFIVFEDADLDLAVRGAAACKFRNNGQACIGANRFLVHVSLAETFAERLAACAAALKVGDGRQPGVDVGPLIDERALAKVERHVEDAVAGGARVLCGGKRCEGECFAGGAFFEPTVLSGVRPGMLIMEEETFGPVAPVVPFRTEDEAVAMANATRYGLAAYFFTRDLSRAFRVAEQLDVGIVGINDHRPAVAQAPFGGVKESGFGREGGHWGLEEFLEVKFISFGL